MPTAPVPLAEPLNGRVVFDESHTSRVSAPVAGRILELRSQLGDSVAAGAVLAVIDAPDLGAAQADLAKAKADESRKELALRRARELFSGEGTPEEGSRGVGSRPRADQRGNAASGVAPRESEPATLR